MAFRARLELATLILRRTSVKESVANWILAITKWVLLVSVLVFQVSGLPTPLLEVPISRRSEYQATDG